MLTPELSVVICTHNPRPEYLSRTLAALAGQTLDRGGWELLVVDNASAAQVAERFDLSFHPRARVVREDTLGLTPARLRGIRETTGATLVLVDDDNVLAADYLAGALALAKEWPRLGVWGGQMLPEFEEPPAEWTRRYWNWIGLRKLERDLWSNVPNDLQTSPFGAGMCVRRPVAEEYARITASDPLRRSLDRTGGKLFAGGDSDLALTACDLGLGSGLFPRLTLTHLMPRGRLTEDYLLQLTEAMTYSSALLRFIREGEIPGTISRSDRLLKKYQSFFIPERDRRFDRAKQSGRESARREIERLQQAKATLANSSRS